MSRSLCILIAGVAFLLSLSPASAQRDSRTIFWESDSTFQQELSAQFGQLYEALRSLVRSGAQIPTEVIDSPGNRTPEQLLRERGQYFGTDFRRAADLFLCELNRSICSVKGNEVTWKNRPNDVILLPKIDFEAVTHVRSYNKSRPERLDVIVVDRLKGCVAFDETCKQSIANLNFGKQEVLAPDYRGTIELPTQGFRALIPLEPGRKPPTVNREPATENFPRIVRDEGQRPAQLPPVEQIRQALPVNAGVLPDRREAAGSVRPRVESQPPVSATTEGDRATILALINHPFALKENLDLPLATAVAVVDKWVFPGHCLYNPRIAYENNLAPEDKLLGTLATKCGERAIADRERDHGTHLVGILGARRDSPLGPGVNPDAYVWTLQIDLSEMTSQVYKSRLAQKLREMIQRNGALHVFNFSLTYPFVLEPGVAGSVDPLETFIAKGGGRTRLFVAAAGQELGSAVRKPKSCPLRPACLELPNIITVGATDLTPRPLCPKPLSTSDSGPGIDLVAPGLDIVSAIARDKVGLLTGSSQAAPLVSGAASLLFAKNDTLDAFTVKNRLIYTADQCPGLRVFGGRLNVARALAFEDSEMRLKGSVDALVGKVVQVDKVVRFTDLNGKSFNVQVRAIKRLFKAGDDQYVLFYHREDPGNESSPLTRREVLIAKTPGILNYALASADQPRTQRFDFRDVLDYVSRIDKVRAGEVE